MTEELLPCPFCGGDAGRKDHWSSALYGDSSKHNSKVVYCTNRKCKFSPIIRCSTQEEADKIWNTRAQPKYKRVDLFEITDNLTEREYPGYARAIDDIKSKYGDLYIMEGK